MSIRILPSGASALLVECAGLDEVLALHDALAGAAPPGLVELVPAARTVLVAVDPARLPLESAASWVQRTGADLAAEAGDAARASAADAEASRSIAPVELPTRYDGDDLAETAALLGLSVEALVARHAAIEWRVAFIGFAPGFAYLVSEDWPFDVPRLAAPRTRVPAGAVALAGPYSGAYPRESPGGWRLVGRTDAPLWSADASSPALLPPGTRVRFREVRP
ncbi:5-oxoprolinase subunit B family protein [Agromyces soli]